MKIFINTTSWAIVKQENETPILAGNNYVDQLKVYYDSDPSTQYFYPLLNILKPNDRKVGLISFDATSVEEPNPSTYTDDDNNTWYMFKFTLSSDNHQIDVSGKYQFTITTNYYNSTNGAILKQRNINTILSVVNAVTYDDNSVLILGDDPGEVVAELYALCQSLQTGVASLQISVSALQSSKADLNNPNQDIVAGSIKAENGYIEDIISEYGAQITLDSVFGGISFKPVGSSKYITIGDGKISGVDTVSGANDVTNKNYVDTKDALKADLNNASQNIRANKIQVDSVIDGTDTTEIEMTLGAINFYAKNWENPSQYKQIIYSYSGGLQIDEPTHSFNPTTKNYVDTKDGLKLDKTNVYNGLDKTAGGYALDARQGKALKDSLDTLYNYVGYATGNDDDTTINKLREIFQFLAGEADDATLLSLLAGKQAKIDSDNKLEADLVDDTTSANKFVSQQEKNQITANKNAIEEIEEAIPTKTSDLTNDSDFIDETTCKNYANNIYSLATNNIAGKDTSTNILAKSSDTGIWIGTDTGHWYYWNGTQYVDGGVYQAPQIPDNSIGIEKINFRDALGLYYKVASQLEANNSYQYYYINGGGTCTYNTSLPDFYVYEYEVEANKVYNIKGEARLGGSYPLVGFKTTSGVSGVNNTPQTIIINGSSSQTSYDVTYKPTQNGYLFVAFVRGYGLTEPIPIYEMEVSSTVSEITDANTDDIKEIYFENYSPNNWQLGYYRANGTIGSYSNYCNNKFEVVNNSTIKVSGINGVGGSADAVSGILFDENNNVLDVITTQYSYSYYIDNENAKYFAVCNNDINNVSNVKITVSKSSIIGDLKSLLQSDFSDKVIYTLGDSITYSNNSWAFQLANKIGCKKVYNLARGGATYGNRSYITKYDENCAIWNNDFNYITSADGKTESYPANTDLTYNNPPSDSSYNQISNQIRFMDRLITEYDRPTPDIIVIACGINDTNSSTPIYNDTDFNNVCNVAYNELTEAQLIRFDYGLRYCIETLMVKYPNVEIMIATPIQTNYGYLRPYLKNTCEWLKAFSVYFSTKLIDTYSECGISAVFEAGHDDMSYVNPNNGRYLYDGLHPNGNGKILMGNYFAKRIFEKHCNIK